MTHLITSPWRLVLALRVLAGQVVSVYLFGQCAELGCQEPHMPERAWCYEHNWRHNNGR